MSLLFPFPPLFNSSPRPLTQINTFLLKHPRLINVVHLLASLHHFHDTHEFPQTHLAHFALIARTQEGLGLDLSSSLFHTLQVKSVGWIALSPT